MRYICICCGAAGADGNPRSATVGPYAYNCHVCNKHQTMWPEPQATKHIRTVAALQEGHGKDAADRKAISALQEQLNEVKAALVRMVTDRDATIALGLKIIDQVLPKAGSISIDVGAVNEFCMRARK